jgi:hypothetical protein
MLRVQKLDLFEYEPEAAAGVYPDEEYGRILDDAEVEQLLLSSLRHTPPARDDEQTLPFEIADDWDGLRAMRGIMVGLALVAPIWGLVIATFVRA